MQVRLGSVALGNRLPLAVIGGINVVESAELALQVAEEFDRLCGEMGIPWIFKASFDKANRSSVHSFRGHGMEQGLQALDGVRQRFGVPLVTDIHLPEQAAPVAEVVDLLQIPAFLCRQTDLLAAAAATGKPLHIKKAQFLAPEDCRPLLEKCRELGAEEVILCERGTSFGYHCLVVDTLGFSTMKALGCPVSFDVTHALQLPGAGGAGDRAGGRAAQALDLALAGVSQGLAALFVETHPDPDRALCDGPSALPLEQLGEFLARVQRLDALVKSFPEGPPAAG